LRGTGPFDGVYQLRRSGAAMHFLQVKHLISTHPLVAGRVDFEAVVDATTEGIDDCDGECEKRKAQVWFN
jgi:hypothetical protein